VRNKIQTAREVLRTLNLAATTATLAATAGAPSVQEERPSLAEQPTWHSRWRSESPGPEEEGWTACLRRCLRRQHITASSTRWRSRRRRCMHRKASRMREANRCWRGATHSAAPCSPADLKGPPAPLPPASLPPSVAVPAISLPPGTLPDLTAIPSLPASRPLLPAERQPCARSGWRCTSPATAGSAASRYISAAICR
jgi:hypothetical protein